jgi:hypothetical protein
MCRPRAEEAGVMRWRRLIEYVMRNKLWLRGSFSDTCRGRARCARKNASEWQKLFHKLYIAVRRFAPGG